MSKAKKRVNKLESQLVCYARSVSPAEKRYENQRRLRSNLSRKEARSCTESTQREDLTLHGGQEVKQNLEEWVKEVKPSER